MVTAHSAGRPRVFEQFIHRIRLDIATGKIGPGEKLSPERRLSTQFQMSRGSIREGIRTLELFGLVRVKRGRDGGVFIAPSAQEVARNSFISLSAPEERSFAGAVEFRKVIEPGAAELAAARATADHLNTLEKTLAMMEENPESTEVFVDSNRVFHETIAAATGNPYLLESLSRLFEAPEITSATGQAVQIQRSLTRFFHLKITEAIAQKNGQAARDWMAAHLAQIEADLHSGRELASGLLPPVPRHRH